MKLKDKNSKQKLRGGFYTPKKISDFIVDWVFNNNNPTNILEPSCGDGVFLESLSEYADKRNFSCKAIELIDEEAKKSEERINNYDNFKVKEGDFFELYEQELKTKKFDAIVGNPPYIRYQYLTLEQRQEKSDILVSNGMKANKSINAWVAFVVASVQMLSDNGRIGLVIPAELLQIYYAEDLRRFLIESLSIIDIVAFDELVFPEVQQEVIILLGEKSKINKKENKVEMNTTEFKSLEELDINLILENDSYKTISHSSDKWTKYFLNNKQINKINNIKDQTTKQIEPITKLQDLESKFVFFKDIAKINVGITTGKNSYFCVNEDTVKEYDLKEIDETILPLIGRSSHIKGIYYTNEDWNQNLDKGEKGYLISFPKDIKYEDYPNKYKEYIKLGEKEEVHTGYKCSIRDRWYCVPSVWSPDAFLLRRNNTFPRFVLDDIGNTVSTDTMHRIKFNEDIDHKKVLLSYYNSITFAFTEIEGRSYGGGVLEILPGELRQVPLPNLQGIDDKVVNDLLKEIDQTIRNGDDIEPILDKVDQKVLVEHLNFNKTIPQLFRSAWKTLMNRRLNRS